MSVQPNLWAGKSGFSERSEEKGDKREKGRQLLGHSPIYGEIAIPVDSIHHLHFGSYEAESFKSVFEEWIVRPAKEPEFGGD